MALRRTPLEAAIAAQTDRQAAYEKRQRDAGLTKTCVWVPIADADALKEAARIARQAQERQEGPSCVLCAVAVPEPLADALRALVGILEPLDGVSTDYAVGELERIGIDLTLLNGIAGGSPDGSRK